MLNNDDKIFGVCVIGFGVKCINYEVKFIEILLLIYLFDLICLNNNSKFICI